MRLGGLWLAMVLLAASGCHDQDARIERKVEDRLKSEGHPNVDVSVHNGVVTLHGNVSTGPERDEVEGAASGIDGVRWVVNKLEIPLPPTLTEAQQLDLIVRKRLIEAGFPQVMVAVKEDRVVMVAGGVDRDKRDEVLKIARGASPRIRGVEDWLTTH